MTYTIVIAHVPGKLLHRLVRRVARWNKKHKDRQVEAVWHLEEECSKNQ